MRRDINDEKWQVTKQRVIARDKYDRILKILSPAEIYLLKHNASGLLNILDVAHYLSVSSRPDLVYKSYNAILLNRYSHSNLDNCRSPVTGDNISANEVYLWWGRILKGNKDQFDYLRNKQLI